MKADGSAVTQADKLGEAIILSRLRKACPDIPILAEEAAAGGDIPDLGDRFFLVDPLDGTREFINKTGEFTINIALVEAGRPVMGVVYAPICDKLYFAAAGEGACLAAAHPGVTEIPIDGAKKISVRKADKKNLVAVASRSHRSPETDAFLKALGVKKFSPAGSSLKFCLIAEGLADVYPRFGRTMEWDTGAGQAVLEAAGGSVIVTPESGRAAPLCYNKKERGYDNPHFVAWGG